MPALRIRVELFKGAKSIDLGKLSLLPEELNKFLQRLGEDLGIPNGDNKWKGSKFKDGSLELDVTDGYDDFELSGTFSSVDPYQLATAVLGGKPADARRAGASDILLLAYRDLAAKCRDGDIRISVFKAPTDSRRSKWFPISQATALTLTDDIASTVTYRGSLIGMVHALFKEVERPYFHLRELTRNELVKCYFQQEHYTQVVSTLKDKNCKVHVSGEVTANRIDRAIESVKISKIEITQAFPDDDLERFFGCAPGITGGLSSEDFISQGRINEP